MKYFRLNVHREIINISYDSFLQLFIRRFERTYDLTWGSYNDTGTILSQSVLLSHPCSILINFSSSQLDLFFILLSYVYETNFLHAYDHTIIFFVKDVDVYGTIHNELKASVHHCRRKC